MLSSASDCSSSEPGAVAGTEGGVEAGTSAEGELTTAAAGTATLPAGSLVTGASETGMGDMDGCLCRERECDQGVGRVGVAVVGAGEGDDDLIW